MNRTHLPHTPDSPVPPFLQGAQERLRSIVRRLPIEPVSQSSADQRNLQLVATADSGGLDMFDERIEVGNVSGLDGTGQ